MSKADVNRTAMRQRIVAAARISLSSGAALDERTIADLCEQVGLHPHAFRQFYPTDDDLLDEVHDVLVDECAHRLRGGVDRFTPTDASTRFADAARALAESWPLERGGMIVRGQRRLRALASNSDGSSVNLAERRFVWTLVDILADIAEKIGRKFSWTPSLAVRVILDTYERSFEAWVLDGHPESEFSTSPTFSARCRRCWRSSPTIGDPARRRGGTAGTRR